MAGPMISSTKLIFDVLNGTLTPGAEDATFTVLARVDSVFPHAGWCYVTCHQCSKAVVMVHGLFVCKICNTPCRYPIVRYRVHLCVGDHTGGTIFTIFNQVAEKLFDSSANKFFRYLGYDRFPVPAVELVGRFFAFKIRLPDHANPDPDFHNIMVVSLHEINPPPALKSYGIVQARVARSKRRSHHVVAPGIRDVAASSTGFEVSTPEKKCNSRKKMN